MWSEFKYLIKLEISNSDDYDEKYLKIRINSIILYHWKYL